MIDQLITALSKEVEMSAAEIADTIWLALQMQEFQAESVSSDLNLRTEDEREVNNQESQSSQGTLPKPKPEISKLEETPNQSLEDQKAGIYPLNEQASSKSSDLSFKVPDAPSLREPLTLARALKPLMRRIPSGRELVLDEAATIQRIADEGLWIPVLRPTVEPWLDLELVVDEAISMQMWRHTIRELERLLKNYGIFRDVRVWGLITDENEQVQIRRGIGTAAKNQTPRSPKELIDPSGRRLVLVVSDCVSSLWRNGAVTPVLELWAKQGLMAIVQMLPKWLWKRTALGRASEVRLRALTPGACNQKLIAREVSFCDELDEETGVKVPVFTLEQDKVATWAQMLSGKGSIWTLGYVFKLNVTHVDRESSLFNLTHSDLSAEQRVQAFRVTASPMARKLAGLLASAPVISLPIVRLIRETLLKDAQQFHVAEVFLGGLLKPLSEISADTNPDYVQYEFLEGVRELLVDSVPSQYVLNVVDEVSKYIAKKSGLSLEAFAAVMKNPQQVRDSEIVEEVGYFATVTAQVLRRLGSEYVKVADEIQPKELEIDYLNESEDQVATSQAISSPSSQQNQQYVDDLVQKVRSRIHDDIQRLHSTMPLWGVDHWVPLSDLFVDVNILEELNSSRRSELDDLWQDFSKNSDRSLDRIGLGRERQRVSGLAVLAKNTNLMVVGKPGSGKTTYLQRVVTECNAGKLQAHRIPALIKLREFVEDGRKFAHSLERYFEQSWQLSNTDINLIFHQGRALVLLDGLDEVTGKDGKSITKQIKQFARSYPQVQVIVTCRTQSQESRFERFNYVEVADFNQAQVRLFADHWFQAVMKDDSAGLARSQEFLNQLFLEANKPIRDLAITPFLLSFICAVFHQTGNFYSKRSKLYEEGLELLLEQWDKSRAIERDEIYQDLSLERKLELLSYLAVKKFEQQQYVLFNQSEIEGYIAEFLKIGLQDSRAVLKTIESQHGLLIEQSQKVWSFSHLSFQEYLTAKYFFDARTHQLAFEHLATHITKPHWREVFLVVVQIIKSADELLLVMERQALTYTNTSKHHKDFEFQSLLSWAEEVTKDSAGTYKPVAKRAGAICIALTIFQNLDIDFLQDVDHTSGNAPYYHEDLGIAYEYTHKIMSAFDLNLNFKLDSVFDFDKAINSAQNLALELTNSKIFKLTDIAKLTEQLEILKLEAINDTSYLQSSSCRKLLNLWISSLKIPQEVISGHHKYMMLHSQLLSYLQAIELIVRCKEVALHISLNICKKIEDSLLLPIAEIEKRKRENAK